MVKARKTKRAHPAIVRVLEVSQFLQLKEPIISSLVSSWLDIKTISILDEAITNHHSREIWMRCLKAVILPTEKDQDFSHSAMRWLITRGVDIKEVVMDPSDSNNISDETFNGMHFPSLREFTVLQCENLTDKFLSLVAVKCPHIEKIILSYCSKITDKGVAKLGHECPQLQLLDISNCSAVGDVGVAALAESCPELRSIYLNDNPVTDVS
jgi:Leucine Rich repeat